jgi:hypothetical protein
VSLAWLKVKLIRFSVTPATVTSRTPLIDEKSGLATSSSVLPNASLFPLFADTPRAMIGTESNDPLSTLALASAGSVTLARAAFNF